MKALLLWFPGNPHIATIDPDLGYTSQQACESDKFTDEEKARIDEILTINQDIPEIVSL